MRFLLLPAIVALLINGVVDFLLYHIIKNSKHNRPWAKLQLWSAVLLAVYMIVIFIMPKRNGSDAQLLTVMWSLYAYISVYVPKYIYLIFRILSRLPKLWKKKPSKIVSSTGGVLAVVVFVLMWWGALINRFNIQVCEVEIPVANLPAPFDGLRIAQISDLHVGTYGHDDSFVRELVDSVNALHPDIIVFTGDMVNRKSEEFRPFISAISKLKAPLGVYSIMGNHDYGDYSDWPSTEAKDADVEALKSMQGKANLKMLNNKTAWIRIDSDSIALIGVENIGDPPFKIYGDLNAAYPNLKDRNVKILLTHNPAHWENDIENQDTNIALSLAGHTHAMQMELFGLSPAAFRYDKWGGLYSDSKGQYLYVNIGAGAVGLPYRIGATPEITLFTLKKE